MIRRLVLVLVLAQVLVRVLASALVLVLVSASALVLVLMLVQALAARQARFRRNPHQDPRPAPALLPARQVQCRRSLIPRLFR